MQASLQEWTKGIGLCDSHRLKRPWCEDRMDWLDAEGKPLEPEWGQSKKARSMQEQQDNAALPEPQEVVELEDWWKGPEND